MDYPEIDRYLANAREILSTKAQKEGIEYKDIKYVQMASGTAYNAALMIADEYLKKREGARFVKPKSIEDYRNRLRKYNKTLLSYLNEAYDTLHLAGYYHGTPSVRTIKEGMDATKKMLAILH
ncbi:DUF5618 family protein [Dyadobacter fanqingshengii]|uniref:DUF5618 family protein n=1 Tax=Dyadobacter fanqingshengii TaxID=2906443 RepID=A0A9X1T7S3_9BACT|nr:DUF5618 family protein [Dyadobacter fanqingshengii]MCF0038628.1 DUF5618 family protein [Dyadobacter fanqingshengii]MCF2503842.1 DUF5618 family protein [Dyadobacter fanqingshengii]USJ34539.1 DUF5618 family protein [Dyadobacter fanqingshengii]